MPTYLTDNAGALHGPVTLQEIPGFGLQLPSNGVELGEELTPLAEGMVWALIDGAPLALADCRGPAYRTDTGATVDWVELGALPPGFTREPRPDALHVWQASAWELDQAAQLKCQTASVLQARDAFLAEATLRIAPLQDAHDLGDSTVAEEAALLSWKRYRIALSRLEQQSGYPLNVEWPPSPAALSGQ